MNYVDYAKYRGYRIVDTPEAAMAELKEIAGHYRALEEKNVEIFKNSTQKHIEIISWGELLLSKHEWFSLSILGLNLPKHFISEVILKALNHEAFDSIPDYLQLTSLAITMLLWVEMNGNEIIFAKDQKELLILLIDTLITKQKIDERLLDGPIKLKGFANPDFTKKYISAVSKKLAGLVIEFKNPS